MTNTLIHNCSSFPKPYPILDQNEQSLHLFSDQNSAKTLPFAAAHTYLVYIREYLSSSPPPPPPGY